MITEKTILDASRIIAPFRPIDVPGWLVSQVWCAKTTLLPIELAMRQDLPEDFVEAMTVAPSPADKLSEAKRIACEEDCSVVGVASGGLDCHDCVDHATEEFYRIYAVAEFPEKEIKIQEVFARLIDGYDLFVKKYRDMCCVCACSEGEVVAMISPMIHGLNCAKTTD